MAERDNERLFDDEHELPMMVRQQAFANGLMGYPDGGKDDGINGDMAIIAPLHDVAEGELAGNVGETSPSICQMLAA